ncbi:ribosomal L1 domain-containing protein 1-like [Asterias rubens]|uniref:ribosomal L1 domain-containing protein 1-like n=1 Tax=Asterias rubens TaxID=7604 RepID=UPI001455A9D5|nr:ribosomal L1 domain-containing protein 1-like [Asterias rubens]
MEHKKKKYSDKKYNKRSHLDEKKVTEAVAALLAFHKKRDEGKEASQALLLNEASEIKIIISVWKIVGKKARTFEVTVPHTLRTPETEICLFAKDVDRLDQDATVRHYKELLQNKGVTEVNEVMPLQQLKKEFQMFTSRRQLAKRYDIFLADERIFRLLHTHLGKEFYKRKKYPVQVDMTKRNLKKEVLKAIDTTRFILTNRGNTNHMTVANTHMSLEQIVENTMAAVQSVTAKIPMGWNNLKALYIRTDESVSLPVHTSLVFKEWERKTGLESNDIWRLKKQLQVTKRSTRKGEKVLPSAEQVAESMKLLSRREKKAAAKKVKEVSDIKSDDVTGEKMATKRKAAPEEEEEEDLEDVVTPAKSTLKEKPRKAATSLRKTRAKMSSPGKLPAKSFSAKKAKRK